MIDRKPPVNRLCAGILLRCRAGIENSVLRL